MAYCKKCNNQLKENDKFCDQCGTPVIVSPPGQSSGSPVDQEFSISRIETYMVKAILITCLCCLPVGIVAIIYAVRANDKKVAGDYQGALEASRLANKWANWGVIAAVLAIMIYLIIIFGFTTTGFLLMEQFL